MNLTRTLLTSTLYVIPLFLVTASVALAQELEPTGVQELLWTVVANLFGWLVGAGGVLLDIAINDYVVDFGTNFLSSGVGVAVDNLWVTTRDFFNLTFIFGLVFLGFKMILNSDDASTRKWLVSLIMAALLVNFSLFITKFIVDFSNILASQIVQNGFSDMGVSTTFMNAFGISSAFSSSAIESLADNNITSTGAYAYIFGTAIVFIIAAFVFAVGGIMLIIRYVILSIYMVLSPLMFLGWVFPQMQGVSKQYWSGFLGKAFYAPIYILMLFFASTIMGNFFGAGGSVGRQDFAASMIGSNMQQNFTNTFPPFIITCVFLIAAVVIANKMGADGAKTAISIGNNMTNRAKRGLQNGAMRVGRGAERTATALPRYAAKRTSYALGNKFDAQFAKMQNSQSRAARMLSNNIIVDDAVRGASSAMKGAKFGFANTVDENKKKKATIDNRYENNLAIQRGLEAESELQNFDVNDNNQMRGQVFSQAANGGNGGMINRNTLTSKGLENILEQNAAKMQSTITNYSGKQLEEMLQQQPQQFNDIIGKLKASQFDKLMDSDNLNQNTKNEIFGKRQDAIKALITRNGQVLSEEVAKLSVKQIEILGDDFIRDNAALLSQSQMDDLKKSDNFTEGQKGAYLGARKSGQIALSSTAANASKLFENTTYNAETGALVTKAKKAVEVANIPFEAFVTGFDAAGNPIANPHTIGKLDSSALEEIFAKKTMNTEQRNHLRDAVLRSGSQSAQGYLRSVLGSRNWNTPGVVNNQTQGNQNNPAPQQNQPPVNPHNQFGSPAEAQRWADWNNQNNP